MIGTPVLMIAAERQRVLRAEAARRALRLTTCCRPTALRPALAAWQERHRPAAACCT